MSGSLRLNGSTSGFSEITAPDVAGDQTFTLPAVGGTLSTVGIRQIVEGSTSTLVSNPNSSWMDTGLTATITPTSLTSKILVIINQYVQAYAAAESQGYGIKVLRNSTEIDIPVLFNGLPLSGYVAATGSTQLNIYEMYSRTLLDSPNSTQALIYKTQGRVYDTSSSGATLNCQPTGTDNNGTSNIYLIEVAA